MKTISALYNKICRLECSCCGEDHYVDFSMPSKKLLDDKSFLYLNFKTSEYRLRDRIRISKDILKRKEQLENKTEVFNSVIADFNQIADLYSTLKLEYEQNDLLKPGDIQDQNLTLELMTSSDEKFHEYSFFTSKEGLMIHGTIEKNIVYDLNIGHALEYKMKYFKLFQRCVSWIFNKKRNSIFEDYEISLSKEEFIKFMNSLNWILQNIIEKSDIENSMFSHMELKSCK